MPTPALSIALWCVLVAAVLPILAVGIAKASGGAYNNHDPRGHAAGYTGLAKRAHAAHANGYEAFPFFAAAVLVAELKGVSGGWVSGLAIAFVLARLAYIGCYLADQPALRSIVWSVGWFVTIAIFVSPLWAR
jgi:uncharacterized MAPEG superfamily protein